MAETPLIEVGIAIFSLALVGAAARRLGQSVIPAYIIAGILVGPYVPTNVGSLSLQLVTPGEFLTVIAELGIVFLLFFLGLEFSIGTLVRNRVRLTKVGGLDILFNGLVGVGIGLLFGFGLVTTVLLTGVVYISSSAIITKALTDTAWLANPESEVILGTLIVEDLVIAVYLAVVSALVVGGGGTPAEIALTVAQSFVFLGGLAALAHYGTGYFDRAFAVESDELFLLRVVGTTVLIGGAALSIGASEAVAAFFVGTAFHGTDLVGRIEAQLSPLRDVFAALFFLSIGVSTDLRVVADVGVLIGVAVVATTVTKVVSGYLSGSVYELTKRRSLRVGIGLVPRGEFSLIIAALAATSPIPEVRTVVPAFTVGYVLAMSIVGSVSIQYSDALARTLGVSS